MTTDIVHILVVTEEDALAQELHRMLTRLGYVPMTAVRSVEEAIQHLPLIRPDLLLMDLCLPDAVDSLATAEQIGPIYAIPIVYLGVHDNPAVLARAALTKSYGYLKKPFDECELHVAIEVALTRHATEWTMQGQAKWQATLLMSMGDGVIATNKYGLVTFMNPTAEHLTGWSSQEAYGQDITDVFTVVEDTTHHLLANPVIEVLRTGVTIRHTAPLHLIARNGSPRTIDGSAAPIRTAYGQTTGVVLVFRDISHQQSLLKELQILANTDDLTHLYNRRGFFTLAQHQLKIAARQQQALVLLFADLDNLKSINDVYGHQHGSKAIMAVADVLCSVLRSSDIIGRLGGDEFIALLIDTPPQSIEVIIERLHSGLQAHYRAHNLPYTLSLSIGVACYDPAAPCSLNDLLEQADAHMYAQKHAKKRMHGQTSYQTGWSHIRGAIESGS